MADAVEPVEPVEPAQIVMMLDGNIITIWILGGRARDAENRIPLFLITRQVLDIKVNEAARLGVFVTDDGLGWQEIPDPRPTESKSGPREDAADGSGRHPRLMRDMLARPALAAQVGDTVCNDRPCLPGTVPRPRGPVAHRSRPANPLTIDRAGYDLGADPKTPRRLCLAQLTRDHRLGHLLSTNRRQSGILMDVHSGRS